MYKKSKSLLVFRYSVILCGLLILILNVAGINANEVSSLGYVSIFILPCIFMSIMLISIGDTIRVDLSDTLMAFVFAVYGRHIGVLFIALTWFIASVINEKFITKRNNNMMIMLNTGMFIVVTYLTTMIINYISTFANNSAILRDVIMTVGFIGIFLIFNVTILWFDFSIDEKKYYKFSRQSIKFLLINFVISSIVAVTMLEIQNTSGIIGSILVVCILLILHYCFYLYKKLKVRNDSINGLLKITKDIVRYGEFREKCKHLINNLNDLIPYTICSIYTFDLDAGGIVYPIAYKAPEDMDIGELSFNISSEGVTIKTIKEGKIYISRDVKRDKKVKFTGRLEDIINVIMLIPFLIGDKVVGLIMIGGDDKLINFATTGIDDMLQILSNQMALAVENDGIYRDMKNKADVDPLTGLYNRNVLDREIHDLIRTNIPFSLVMYDIDDFKKVNDTHGHLAGDEVLKEVSDIIKRSIRKTDVPCRYGGEEIVIIFKDLKKEDAFIISERIRNNIQLTSTIWSGGQIFVTISGGVASYPEDGTTKEEIIKTADEVLYTQCKRKGKNRVYASRIINEVKNLLDHA